MTVPSALSYRYYGSDEFILNDETFVQDTGTSDVMYYAFDTTDETNAAMESFLADYTENVNPELDYESKATYAGEFESMRSMFLLLGGALSFIVGLVGVLNSEGTGGAPGRGHDRTATARYADLGRIAVRSGGGRAGSDFDADVGPDCLPGGGRTILVFYLPSEPHALPVHHPSLCLAWGWYSCYHRP